MNQKTTAADEKKAKNLSRTAKWLLTISSIILIVAAILSLMVTLTGPGGLLSRV